MSGDRVGGSKTLAVGERKHPPRGYLPKNPGGFFRWRSMLDGLPVCLVRFRLPLSDLGDQTLSTRPDRLTLTQHVRLWTPSVVAVAATLLTAGVVWGVASHSLDSNTEGLAALELRVDHHDDILLGIREGQGVAAGERFGMQKTLDAILKQILKE